jgi:hypothetical protein
LERPVVRAPLSLAVLGMLAATPICGAAAQSDRTVSWYLRHPQAIGPKLAECEDDEAVARADPECGNAQRAADRLARMPRARAVPQPPIQTPDQMLTSPRYYAENPIARDLTIAKCQRGAGRPRDCQAAYTALGRRT